MNGNTVHVKVAPCLYLPHLREKRTFSSIGSFLGATLRRRRKTREGKWLKRLFLILCKKGLLTLADIIPTHGVFLLFWQTKGHERKEQGERECLLGCKQGLFVRSDKAFISQRAIYRLKDFVLIFFLLFSPL